MAIETAKDLYVANGADLRHWHDVSSDIIKYLKDKLNRAAEAVVYKGVLPNLNAFNALEDTKKGDVWTNEETGVNLMWDGERWIPVSLFRMDFDKEAIENSINGIQSGYIWTALQNFIDDPTIYRIVEEAEQDPELQGALRDVSSQLADIILDIADIRTKYARIPDPLISNVESNEIVNSEDGGIFFDSEHCRLADRLTSLENSSPTTIERIVANGDPVVVGESSPSVVFIEADQDLHIVFDPLPRTSWMMKHIYIESSADISIEFQNADFNDMTEDPIYGIRGYSLLLRCIWVGGKVVVEVVDNSQMAENVNEWSDADGINSEEPQDPDGNDNP